MPLNSIVEAARSAARPTRREAMLAVVVSRIVPHQRDVLKRETGETAKSLARQIAADEALRASTDRVLGELSKSSKAAYWRGFLDLIPDQQLILMERAQNSVDFQVLVYNVLTDYYKRPTVWKALGYDGPMNDRAHPMGGYLNKGYDKLGW